MLVVLPKPPIDYVAIYNELTKPADFSPENNAADHYLRAGELYIEQPEELVTSNLMQNWSEVKAQNYGDIDPNELQLLESWLTSNKPAIDQIQLALQKPYCWFERKTDRGTVLGITFPESHVMRIVYQVFTYSAKLNSLKGDFKSAAENLIDCYRIGQHQCRDNLSVIEQFAGIRIKNHTISTALDVLANSEPSDEQLKYFQTSLQDIVSDEDYTPGLSTEKIFLYDVVQHVYLDWIRGINKPSFRVLLGYVSLCDDHINNMWVNAFVGPSRQKILKQIESLFETYDQIKDKTPWQIHHQHTNQVKTIKNIVDNDFFMRFWGPTYFSLFSNFQNADSQTEALITVLGILRFKADNNRFPETLQELLSKGYIDYLPKDPYSEGDLMYRVLDDDFVLYSFGKDFEDNNGEVIIVERDQRFGLKGMAMPKMPSQSPVPTNKEEVTSSQSPQKIKETVYKDIVYWPVTNIPEYIDPFKMN